MKDRSGYLLKSFSVLGVEISAVNISLACSVISYWIDQRIRSYVCIVPVATVVECQKDKRYLDIVNNAGMAAPDGMPVVWLGKLSGDKTISRTYGPDLMLAVCQMSQEKGYKHYFYGGTPEACRMLEARLQEKFPRVTISGKRSPPFRDLTEEEDRGVVEEINRLNPDILWIGLGSPRQDYWMAEHRSRLNVPVLIGVGAAFDFLSGKKKQAPRWMRNAGLEWFFRLCSEPRRLWKRYLVGNTQFIYYLLKNFLSRCL